jgi:hypothetical protein
MIFSGLCFNKDGMTSETDDKAGRRPPTIELAATEVDAAAEKPQAEEAEAAATDAAEHEAAGSKAPTSDRSGTRLTSQVVAALVGAAAMAAAAAVLWFAGVIPMRETAPIATAASDSSAPAAPSTSNPPPNPPSSPPPSPAAAQNSPAPDLTARLDKIEHAIEAQRGEPALGNRIVELAAQTKALADNLTALARRVDDIAATSQSAAKQADTALNVAGTAKSASETASKDQVRHEDVDALASRIMALESAVKGLVAATAPLASSGANDRTARLTIAAEALRAAVELGAPYQAELSAVQALGVDQKMTAPLEPLAADGVPSASALARELEALLPALAEATEPRSGDTSFVERLKSNAQKLVRITPLNAPAGNDPQAVIDRIRLDATHADIGAALADSNALPEEAKPLVAAWSKKAAARQAALSASRQIAADALAALAQSSGR